MNINIGAQAETEAGLLTSCSLARLLQVFDVYSARLDRDYAVAQDAMAMNVIGSSTATMAGVLVSNLVARGTNSGKRT